MITKEIKISNLLDKYPRSLDVLLGISPHFSKLKNRVLRKALAGRVTVEQAASIAGVDLNNLLDKLNESVSSSNLPGESLVKQDKWKSESYQGTKLKDSDKPEYLKSVAADKISYLDVRPIINSGKDPLKNILSKIKELETGEVLELTNSFEPIPLYNVLGKKGFSHWTEQKDGIFKVHFYKENETSVTENEQYDSSKKINENDFDNVIEVDVHELQPPEPIMKILESLNQIDDKSVMLVHHHREPVLLYPKLEEREYYAYCEKISDESFKILIAKKTD